MMTNTTAITLTECDECEEALTGRYWIVSQPDAEDEWDREPHAICEACREEKNYPEWMGRECRWELAAELI